MAENQYQYYKAITKIKRQGCNSGYSGSIYKYDQSQDNNNGSIIRENS